MNKDVTITLTVDEINTVLTLLGQMPTSTGIWPVIMKIKEQGDKQITPVAPTKE